VEFAALLAFALLVMAVGIRLGMLLAPRIERMADRAGRSAGTSDIANEPDLATEPELATEPNHEDHDDRTP
jgi:hypothetical protein